MSELADGAGSGAATKTWLRFPALRRWGLDRKQTALLAGILLLTLLAYLRSLGNGFVYDDFPAIVRNHRLRQWSFIWASMTRDVWWYYGLGQPPQSSYYRPLQNICLGLSFHLVGLHAAGWHLLKILLHLCAVVLSFRLAQLLTASTSAALLVALLFGLLPANGAAVVSIQALGEPLAAVFAMSALCKFIQRSKTHWLGMAWPLLLFAGAAFSHETAVLFPLLIAAYVFLFETTDGKAGASPGESASLARRIVQAAARSAPFLSVALLYMGARALVLGPAGVLGLSAHKVYLGPSTAPVSLFQPHPNLSLAQILMTIPIVLVHYVELLVFPWLAGPAHGVNGVMTPSLSRLYVPVTILVLLALLGYLVFRNSPRSKLYLFCLTWSLVALAPALSFNHIVAFVQDRYLYLASFAFCLWLATCATEFAGTSVARSRAVTAAVIALTVLDIGKLWRMEPIWHDNVTLFTRCVQDFPDSVYYHRILASTLMKNGDFAAAAPHLRFIYKPGPEETKEKESGR
jgi:hypothetical protein